MPGVPSYLTTKISPMTGGPGIRLAPSERYRDAARIGGRCRETGCDLEPPDGTGAN